MKNKIKILCYAMIFFSVVQLSCKKEQETEKIPALTIQVDYVYPTYSRCIGTITDQGSDDINNKGFCWSTENNPTIADNKTQEIFIEGTSFYGYLNNLQPDTKYYVKAFATNSAGTGYSEEVSILTKSGQPPTAITLPVTNIGLHSATLNGSVNPNDILTLVTFEYGLTIDYGYTVTFPIKIGEELMGRTLSVCISGLSERTTYHYRVKAENPVGTAYGNDVELTTADKAVDDIIFNPDLNYGSVSDNDGNTYKTIQIGTQTWMAENLRTTKFKNGTTISGYSWYNNDSANYKSTYGALYDWYTIWFTIVGYNGNVCPTGWHIPSDDEWSTLTTYLGGEAVAGSKLKEIGTIHWTSPNTDATNLSGFSALPGGYSLGNGIFHRMGVMGYWWSSSRISGLSSSLYYAWYRAMYNNYSNVSRSDEGATDELSVRCIKD